MVIFSARIEKIHNLCFSITLRKHDENDVVLDLTIIIILGKFNFNE